MSFKFTYIILLAITAVSCKKYLEIKEVKNQFLVDQVFSSDSAANTAVAGIYRKWRDLYSSISSPTILCGLSSDELASYTSQQLYQQFYKNQVSPNNEWLPWADLYNIIYQANACINSLDNSSRLTAEYKNYYMGEALVIRAYCYFSLVNLFGEVPILLTTDVKQNSIAKRQPVQAVYVQILSDLKAADTLLEKEIFSPGQKERASQLVVKSFLSRVYLFRKDWKSAKDQADLVIQSNKYEMAGDLDDVFVSGSKEPIFFFSDNELDGNSEARAFIPRATPNIICTNSFLGIFEASDRRKTHWLHTFTYQGNEYFYPFKYKSAENEQPIVLLRLAELLLNRAEANVHLNDIQSAVEDLNVIRYRSGLSLLDDNISEDSCLNVIAKERRAELFAETGHRWFDLKRTGKVNDILGIEKGSLWSSGDSLYPLPADDIQRNPNLSQNTGYN